MSTATAKATPTPVFGENNTIYVAVEISRKSWVVGIKSPTRDRIGLHTLPAADTDALKTLIKERQAKAEHALGQQVRVVCCYEAGYEGFWLARWFDEFMSVETVVLDPASLLINRKAKQRKTDRIDAKKMVRALRAHDRGDSSVLSQVRVPTIEEEDRKRKLRERQRLVKERTALTNSIKGLLKLHGIFDLNPRGKGFKERLNEVETAYGKPFPAQARKEIFRLLERLQLAQQQIAEIEAERDEVVSKGATIAIADTVKGSDEQAAAKIATLSQLKAIGSNDATLLVNEVFYRDFRNRRELAGWVGIAPTPHASGDTEHDQGIGGDGPGWIRANLIQMAWRWVRYQPDSALSKWFVERTAGAKGRMRRVMVVALARKLLIALWRFCETGLVPTEAKLA